MKRRVAGTHAPQRGRELLSEGGFGPIQDTITLSPQACRAMGA